MIEFRATQAENFQSVVVVRIVRRRHHDAHAIALLGNHRDAGRREATQVDRDGAAGAQPGEDRGGQWGRTLSSVVPDEHRDREHVRHRATQPVGQVYGDLLVRSSANAVRAKAHGLDH